VRLAALVFLTACTAAPARPELAPAPCLVHPPPVQPVLHSIGSPTCPKPWESCLTLDDALRLAHWRAAVADWQADAWRRCGP
jgi:hypothetical protein